MTGERAAHPELVEGCSYPLLCHSEGAKRPKNLGGEVERLFAKFTLSRGRFFASLRMTIAKGAE